MKIKVKLTCFFLFTCFLVMAQTGEKKRPFRFEKVDSETERKVLQNEQSVNQTTSDYQEIEEKKSQPEPVRTRKKGKIELGGSFGMTFSNGTSINISPQIGYRINSYFSFGGGIGYNYYRYNTWDDSRYTMNYMGLNLYARVKPIPYITIQAQPEIQRNWGRKDGHSYKGEVIPCFLVGAGANLPIAGKSGISVMLYYDVVQNKFTPYGNKIFYSVGYSFGF